MEEVNTIFLNELKKFAESDYNLSSEQVNLLIGIAKMRFCQVESQRKQN